MPYEKVGMEPYFIRVLINEYHKCVQKFHFHDQSTRHIQAWIHTVTFFCA